MYYYDVGTLENQEIDSNTQIYCIKNKNNNKYSLQVLRKEDLAKLKKCPFTGLERKFDIPLKVITDHKDLFSTKEGNYNVIKSSPIEKNKLLQYISLKENDQTWFGVLKENEIDDNSRGQFVGFDFRNMVLNDEPFMLRLANCQRANFASMDLKKADFQCALLHDANFKNAQLQQANCRGAIFRHANLEGANIWHADLLGADLSYACLKGADLQRTDLRSAILYKADLFKVDLHDANLCGADLRDTNLRGADLRGANLRNANLRGADLRGADLRGADLRGADLRGADLRGAIFCEDNVFNVRLYQAKMDGAVYDTGEISHQIEKEQSRPQVIDAYQLAQRRFNQALEENNISEEKKQQCVSIAKTFNVQLKNSLGLNKDEDVEYIEIENINILTKSLNAASEFIKDPTDKNAQKQLEKTANQIKGRPNIGATIAGSIVAFLGAIIAILGVMAEVLSLGIASPVAIPMIAIGGTALLTGSTAALYCSRRTGQSKLLKEFEKDLDNACQMGNTT